MNYRRAVASMLFALCAAPALWAHPHVFIDSSLEFEMSGRDCVGIVVSWTFDVVFSADIIGQFDKDRDGAFNEAETATVQAKAFSNLRKYGYFTFVRKGSVRTCPEAVEAFGVSQSDGRVTYRFRVPLEGKGVSDDFSVATFDSTFYCATKYVDGAASVRWIGDRPADEPTIAIAANKDYPVYYNPLGSATDSRVYTKWEKGLQTAYPEEIRVRF